MSDPNLTWREIATFISPAGQQQLIDFVRRAQIERGANWLSELQVEFPMFCWIVDLVCNRSPDEAFTGLQQQFPAMPLSLIRGQLETLHHRLKTEIERTR